MVPIYENYKDYAVPDRVKATVAKLLACLPERYLLGLRSVVLTNSAAMSKGKTHRVGGRKYMLRDCMGFYNLDRGGKGGYVDLLVDNILAWSAAHSTPERDLLEYAFADI